MKLKYLLLCCIAICAITLPAQNANFNWVKHLQKTDGRDGFRSTTDKAGNVYITDFFTGTIDVDPGSGVLNMTARSLGDGYISKLSPQGTLVWARHLEVGGYGLRTANIVTDNEGNVYTCGFMNDTLFFNPATDTNKIGYENIGFLDDNYYYIKLDADGNFIWGKSLNIHGSNFGGPNLVISDSGYLYATGGFTDTVDFNFNDTVAHKEYGRPNELPTYFVLKLDNDAQFQWVRTFKLGTDFFSVPTGFDIAVSKAGEVYMNGMFHDSVDFDPGAGRYMQYASFFAPNYANNDIFFSKWDAAGNFVWAKQLAVNVNNESVEGLTVDSAGNMYSFGQFYAEMDFDPGAGVTKMLCPYNTDMNYFVLKLKSNGDFGWAKQFYCNDPDPFAYGAQAITSDAAGNIYMSGSVRSCTIDFDPGAASYRLSFGGYQNVFMASLNSAGQFRWARQLTAPDGACELYDISAADNGRVYVGGDFTSLTDFDPSSLVYPIAPATAREGFILKLEEDTCPTLLIVYDTVAGFTCNGNNAYVAMHVENGAAPYRYRWGTPVAATDSIVSPPARGVYAVTVTDNKDCTASSAVVINGDTASVDLEPTFTALSSFRRGDNTRIVLQAINNSCTADSGILKLIMPKNVAIDDIEPTPTTVIGDTFLWNTGSIHYLAPLNVTFQVKPSSAIVWGNLGLHFAVAVINNPRDIDSTNNSKLYSYSTIGAFDPNTKGIYPQGECDDKVIRPNETLTYTLTFQNTGNDSAHNIFLLDTLSQYLDVSTIQVQESSHTVVTEIQPGNVAKFRFDNIYLVDSATNEPESHGHVSFTIETTPNAIKHVIANTCDIYFDYNEPVRTNTVANLIDNIPVMMGGNGCAISGIEEPEATTASFNLFPNPANSQLTIESIQPVKEVTVLDIAGKQLLHITPVQQTEHLTLSTAVLTNGMYLVQVNTAQGIATRKLVVGH